MPKIAQELFLVGSLDSTQPSVFAKDGKNVENYWRDKLREIRKEFRKTEGEIWHHLEEYTDHKDILQRNGSWIKTDIKVWSKSFSKMSTKMKWGRSKEMSGEIYPRGITGIYSKDHCEVFFDEKV